MRNKSKALILIIAVLLSSNFCLCVNYFELGKNAFNNKNYSSAEHYLKLAVNSHPQNVNYRYYYSQALVHLNNYKEAQKQYNIIIDQSPDSEAARLAVIGTKYIQSYYISSSFSGSSSINYGDDEISRIYKDNYIKNAVMSDGKLIKWPKSAMPIKVFIQTDNLPADRTLYAKSVQDAFKAWQSISGGAFSFVFVKEVEKANILTSFVAHIDENESSKGFTSGTTKPYYKGDSMILAKIILSVQSPNQKVLNQNVIYNTALHEIGHALGIWGHSEVDGDIMKPVSSIDESTARLGLSKRDINTIMVLYKGNNKQVDSVLGSQNQRKSEKLKESLLYVKKAPNSATSWAQLAKDYADIGEYNNAIINYKKALEINPKYYAASELLAQAYYSKGDKIKSYLQYQDLISKNPSNIDYSCNLAKLYIKNNQPQMASEVIQKLISNNPKAAENADVKAIKANLH